MRMKILAAIGLLATAIATSATAANAAGGESGGSASGRTIDASARIFGGRYAGGGGGGDGNCAVWLRLADGGLPGWIEEGYPPPHERVVDGITEEAYYHWCGELSHATAGLVWVPQITADDVLPELYEILSAELDDPVTRFEALDPEFGWAYVRVPLDVRVDGVETVSVTASLSAGPLSVWATVTATPTMVRYGPGEPRGAELGCAYVDATAPYYPTVPGACSYLYKDTSAVSPNGRTFTTSTAVAFAVTYDSSSGSGTYDALETSSTTELAVAEIQALVTCTGPLPEQGGC